MYINLNRDILILKLSRDILHLNKINKQLAKYDKSNLDISDILETDKQIILIEASMIIKSNPIKSGEMFLQYIQRTKDVNILYEIARY